MSVVGVVLVSAPTINFVGDSRSGCGSTMDGKYRESCPQGQPIDEGTLREGPEQCERSCRAVHSGFI